MKGIFISLAFSIIALFIVDNAWLAEHTNLNPVVYIDETDSLPEDGWYTAKVTYSSHRKTTKTTSELKVQIKNDRVIKIDLENGKILEAGESQSDYFFSGGVLNFKYNFKTKAKIAKTSVKIKEVNGNLSFYDISII